METVQKPNGGGSGGGGGVEMGRRESDAVSVCFSDAEDRSWHSPYNSNGNRSYEEYRRSSVSDLEIGGVSEPHRKSSTSDCSVEVDLETGVPEIKVHLAKVERDCRICHLTLEVNNTQESGIPIELGCSCKEDLAAAHKHCAEAWFKIKGNKEKEDVNREKEAWRRTCEICGSLARNVVGASETEFIEQWNESNTANATTVPAPAAENRSFWHGHRFLNFLLACMVFAFVISWLFHFNVPS